MNHGPTGVTTSVALECSCPGTVLGHRNAGAHPPRGGNSSETDHERYAPGPDQRQAERHHQMLAEQTDATDRTGEQPPMPLAGAQRAQRHPAHCDPDGDVEGRRVQYVPDGEQVRSGSHPTAGSAWAAVRPPSSRAMSAARSTLSTVSGIVGARSATRSSPDKAVDARPSGRISGSRSTYPKSRCAPVTRKYSSSRWWPWRSLNASSSPATRRSRLAAGARPAVGRVDVVGAAWKVSGACGKDVDDEPAKNTAWRGGLAGHHGGEPASGWSGDGAAGHGDSLSFRWVSYPARGRG
jgi:hypothetical protein